jgi:hypothetical protein
MTDPTPLDPDEVACPRCASGPGVPCRRPNGDKSPTIHVARRRNAAAGIKAPPASSPREPKIREKPPGSSSFTKESAAAAARKSAQTRARRKAEAAAAREAARERLEREALEAEAQKLAEDAVRFSRDRAILRRQTLDAASLSYTRLIEGLEGLQRIQVDSDGRPVTVAEEYEDREGRTRTRMVADLRGAYPASVVERLAKVAASTLLSLRLEEGKPSGILENRQDTGAAEVLGAAGVDELLQWASSNLPRKDET